MSRWYTFAYSRSRKWKYYRKSTTTHSVAPAAIFNQCATETQTSRKANIADAMWFMIVLMFSLRSYYTLFPLTETHQHFLQSAVSPETAKTPSPCPEQPPYNREAGRHQIREGLCTDFSNLTSDLPNNIPHQEEEGVLGWGAEILSIYCYLLMRGEEINEKNRCRNLSETAVREPTIMYAFLLMNLMKCSKHQKQHLRQQSRNRENALWEPVNKSLTSAINTQKQAESRQQGCFFKLHKSPFNLWSKYSRTIRIICTRDRIKEPKASEPVW